MKPKTYNDAWSAVEFLMFEYMDMNVDLKVVTGVFTKEEGDKLFREYESARDAILEKFGVTYEELNAETDRIMNRMREN